MMKTSLAVSSASFALSLLLLAVPGPSRAQNLFVSNFGNNTIEEFNSSGGVLSSNATVFASSGLDEPWGLACDSVGNLYVANGGNNTIEKFKSSGVGTVFASGLNGPVGLAFDSSGSLYVANNGNDWGEGTIEKLNSSGVGTILDSGLNFPWGLAFDSAGNLYVADAGDNTIEKYDSSGKYHFEIKRQSETNKENDEL